MTRINIRYFNILLSFLLITAMKSMGQVTVTSSDSLSCTQHTTTLTASVEYDDPINSGIAIDDIYPTTPSNIGFPFNFYGTNYTQCLIGPNGTISFNTSLAGSFVTWVATGPLLGQAPVFNSICGPWCDIDVSVPGSGIITYSLTGTAPFRKFIITFCHTAMFSCTTQWTTSQMILYETTNVIDVHVGHKDICPTWYGTVPGLATIGVQNATGTAATAAPGRDFAVFTCTNESWRFTPNAAFTAYTVASIPYSPVPRSAGPGIPPTIHWYNATTGAYLGTGSQQVVTVAGSSPVLYRACAVACNITDTSNGYYLVSPGGGFDMNVTSANPSMCGLCDGSLTLSGLPASTVFTVTYNLGGVPQAPIIASSNAAGQLVIGGLCAGTYSNLIATFDACSTPPKGPFTLVDPTISISSITPTNPSLCGVCDGSLVINGLYASHVFTVTYDFNGVPQTPINTVSSAAGTITITGLCNGVYSNIIAKFGSCITPAAGPVTLTDPPISISSVNTTDPTFCGVCDGTITLNGLYPNHDFAINYNFNGVAQPPIYTTSSATGTITISNLCAGTYTNIIASFGDCITPAVGPYTLSNPPTPPLDIFSFTNPSQCGYCDGEIIIRSVTPFTTDTVRFTKDGTAVTYVAVAQSDSSVHLINLCAGNYTGFTLTIGACVYTVNGAANLTTIPVVSDFSYTVRPGCPKDTVSFSNLSTSTPGTPIWYVWNFGDGSSDTSTNPTHVYTQGTYTVTLLATNHACDSILSQQIILSHPLIAEFVDTPNIICQGRQLTFVNTTTSATSAANMQWLWTYSEPSATTAQDGIHQFDNMGVFTVTLVATDSINCKDTAAHVVVVDTSGGIVLKASDTVVCEGMMTTFEGLFSPIGNTGVTWNFGDNDQKINENPVQHAYHSPGTYTVTINALYRACETQTTQRDILVYPQPQVTLGNDTTICKGSTAIDLVASTDGNPAIKYLWNTGQTSRVIQITEPGQYYVTSVLSGCTTSDSILVQDDCYMNIPNVFTPNGDGVNDYFFPRSMLTRGLTAFHMQIFNRWGNMLFETRTLDGRGWDGKYNNIDQPQGAFIYVIDATFKDGQKEHHQGNVTLLR